MIHRDEAISTLIRHQPGRFYVTGLGNAANDVARALEGSDSAFTMDGAMGAAASVGLGLALARPEHRIVVVTGDGELLMNVGSLATIGLAAPTNLAIVCLDNERYELTGGQATHSATSDLAAIAVGSGIPNICTVVESADLAEAARRLDDAGPTFVHVKVEPGNTQYPELDRDGVLIADRFRKRVAGATDGSDRRGR